MRFMPFLAAVAVTVLVLPIARADEPKDIVDTAVGAGSFKTLVAAVKAAELVETLKGKGPFTVFAPTDDAFLALAGALNASAEDLLALPELADILLYHVVGAQVLSTDLADGATATTLNGADVAVTINGEGIFINEAQVTVADIVTDNGVTIIGYTDFPSRMGTQASTLYSTNIRHLLTDLTPAKDGVINHNMEDDVIRGATVAHQGAVTFPPPPPKIAAIAAQNRRKRRAN